MTTNVSRSGMLVRFPAAGLSGELPRVGEQARVVIELPPSTNYSPRSLECFARVVRAEEPAGGVPCLAFEVERMQIRDRNAQDVGEAQGASRLVH
jgi:hypothetical protein